MLTEKKARRIVTDQRDRKRKEQCYNLCASDFIVTCWQRSGSRRMLIFLMINMIFIVVEMCYGIYVNSLSLISDAFHIFSDCFSILVALIASYISSQPADKVYTYGYERFEMVAGLFNCIFLLFVAFNVVCESFERLY